MTVRGVLGGILLALVTGCAWLSGETRDAVVERPEDALALYARANLLEGEGRPEEARNLLREALRKDSGAVFLYSHLAELDFHLGDDEAGVQALRKALKLDPDAVEALLLMAFWDIEHDRLGEAIPLLLKVVRLQPEREGVRLKLGIAYLRQKDFARAERCFHEELERDPDAVGALLALGLLYQRAGQPDRAEKHYREVLARRPDLEPVSAELGDLLEQRGHFRQAEAVLLEGLRNNPESVFLRLHLARILVHDKRLDEALPHYRKVLELEALNVEALRVVGLICLDRGRWREAEKSFASLLEPRPDLAEQARLYIAVAQENDGRGAEALKTFQAIAPDTPFFEKVLLHVGMLSDRQHQYQEGIAFFERHLEHVAASPVLFGLLSFLYERADRMPEALKTLEDGLHRFPGNPDLLYRKGALLERQGRSSEALAVMEEVVRLNDKHSEALNFVAYSLAEQGRDLERALRLGKMALALDDSAHIRDTVGWVYFKLARYSEALLHLQNAAEHLAENIIGIAESAARTAGPAESSGPGPVPEIIRSELIVLGPFFRIAQHIICFRNLLEFVFRSLVSRIFVRMIFHRQLAVSLFQFRIRGAFRHA